VGRICSHIPWAVQSVTGQEVIWSLDDLVFKPSDACHDPYRGIGHYALKNFELRQYFRDFFQREIYSETDMRRFRDFIDDVMSLEHILPILSGEKVLLLQPGH
jgi:hypothetical protein